jgi:hypothetical protein
MPICRYIHLYTYIISLGAKMVLLCVRSCVRTIVRSCVAGCVRALACRGGVACVCASEPNVHFCKAHILGTLASGLSDIKAKNKVSLYWKLFLASV